ncbi:MAG: M12 family metallo-peptidase [Verrucomicrobiota bacterium]
MSNRRVYLPSPGFWASLIALASLFPCHGQTNSTRAPADSVVQQRVVDQLHVGKFTLQDLESVEMSGELKFSLQLAGQPHQIVLQKHSLRAPGFRVVVQDGNGGFHDVPAPDFQTYRGYVAGCGGSSVLASFTKGRIRAFVRLGDANDSTWVIEPLQTVLADAAAGQHVVYNTEDSGGESGVCGNHDVPMAKDSGATPRNGQSTNLDVLVCQIACDADYEYYTLNGSSVSNTVADIETIINGVSAIFERDTGVSFQLTQILVRSAEPDPYDATTADGLLAQFRLDWINNHQDIPRDIAHLFTGKNFGSIIGDSIEDQVCPGFDHYSFACSRSQTDLGKRIALSAHEIGHSFNAYHCDYDSDPRCRIMCSSLGGCSVGYYSFEDLNIARIRATAASAACLTAGTVTTPTTSLPFADNFNNNSSMPDPAKWTAADQVDCQYQHLEINIGRGFNYNQKLGTVRTLPMQLSGAALVQYKVNPDEIPSSQSFIIEYFDSSSFTWQNLRTIIGDGSTQYQSYTDTVPASAAGPYFAVRFSAYSSVYTAAYAWYVDDVSISQIAVAPLLSIASTPTNAVVISWPQPAPDWQLEATADLTTGSNGWTVIAPPYPTNATQYVVTDLVQTGSKFYRLLTP